MTQKIKMTMHAHLPPEWYGGEYWLSHSDSTAGGFVYLGPVEVEFTPPETPSIDSQAAIIDEAMGKVRAEMEERLSALEEQRRKLVCGAGQ